MRIKNIIVGFLTFCVTVPYVFAQSPMLPMDAPDDGDAVNRWEVNVRQMPDSTRAEITETMSRLKGTDEDRGIISEMGQAVGLGIVSGLVEAVVSETYNLAQYRKRQKQEWMKMIQNENNYTDSITFIKGLKDFYNANSTRGALDPSDINFDGIEIRGMRNGQEVIYMSCSIDRDKLDHMFRHSKFNLVLDSLAFYPFQCHLPNVTANGIRTMKEIKKGNAEVKGDTILRPGAGGNGFSFDERNHLSIGIDFTLYSSWINQAVQVHRDVALGNFKFNINIPDNVRVYKYSRKNVVEEAQNIPEGVERDQFLTRNLLAVEGDCFVVPRSYMPLDNGQPMWGTGEYNIKVKFRESCQFAEDSEKAKHWREDYKRLRQMQDKSSEVQEYFQTLWNQYGNSLVKSSYKTALTVGANNLTAPLLNGGSSMSSAAGANPQGAAGTQGGSSQSGAGQSPSGTPPAM